MPDRRPDYDHILATRPEGGMVRALEQQGRRLRQEQRVGQPVAEEVAAAVVDEVENIRFRAQLETARTIPNNSFTAVVFDTIDYEPMGVYNGLTGLFTCPNKAAGVYAITAAVSIVLNNAGTTVILSLFHNGVEVSRGTRFETHSAGTYGVSVSDLLLLEVDDTVGVGIFHLDGGNRLTDVGVKRNHFSMHRLS
jgi:hypothetical protein